MSMFINSGIYLSHSYGEPKGCWEKGLYDNTDGHYGFKNMYRLWW